MIVWNALQFDVAILWLVNGVLAAACLQLSRRNAVFMLIVCSGLNLAVSLINGHGTIMDWAEPASDLVQVLIVVVLTRYLCGGSLDLRHPKRMVAFALGAALPAVMFTTVLMVLLLSATGPVDLVSKLFIGRHLFLMEYLGLLTMTPCLLLLGQKRTSQWSPRQWLEGLAWLTLLAALVTVLFSGPQPLFSFIFALLMILAYRLQPPWVAMGIILVSVIGGVMTLYGYGPVVANEVRTVEALSWAPDVMRQVPPYYAFLLSLTCTALPISALVTDRRRLVRRLARRSRKAERQSSLAREAVASKRRFLAKVSHEMRTPLNAIQGFTEVLRHRTDLSPDVRHQVEAIGASGDALLVLIEDLLDTSEGGVSINLVSAELASVIHQATAEAFAAALAKGLGIRFDLDRLETGPVLFDARRLGVALRHLASNAVKFSHRGEIKLVAWSEHGRVVIQVHDQGPGIAQDFIPFIFEPFTQGDDRLERQHGGAGIGLTSARHHARAMGGDLVLVSTSAAGSVFELSAHVASPAGVSDPRPADQPAVQKEGGRRILIVDDIDLNRSVMRLMVEAAGYEAEEAASGPDALALMSRSSFGVVLMDLRMPGMDGYETSRRIRATHQPGEGPIIIAVTADSSADLLPRLADVGIDSHLPKPFTRDSLLDRLSRSWRGAMQGA